MSSLANLYERRGDTKRAATYRKRAASHRKQNPYYRYHLARDAFSVRHYDTAIGHLKFAVRKKPNEDMFLFLLGLSYLESGNERAARRWMTRAEEAAATDALRRDYASKIDALLPATD